jgi:hypothetical protein
MILCVRCQRIILLTLLARPESHQASGKYLAR